MNVLRSIVVAFAMYSRIPMPKVEWTPQAMAYAIALFPLVGLVEGLVSIAFGLAALALGLPEPLLVVGLALLPGAVNGGIHLDGLADTSDALASHAPRERKLEILKDPNIGAFGAIALASHLLVLVAVYASMDVCPAVLAALPSIFVLSRVCSAWAVVCWPQARARGSVRTFSDGAAATPSRVVLVVLGLAAAVPLVLLQQLVGVLVLAGLALAIAQYRFTAMRNFGGVTGDVAGWFLQNAELYMLVALVVGGVWL